MAEDDKELFGDLFDDTVEVGDQPSKADKEKKDKKDKKAKKEGKEPKEGKEKKDKKEGKEAKEGKDKKDKKEKKAKKGEEDASASPAPSPAPVASPGPPGSPAPAAEEVPAAEGSPAPGGDDPVAPGGKKEKKAKKDKKEKKQKKDKAEGAAAAEEAAPEAAPSPGAGAGAAGSAAAPADAPVDGEAEKKGKKDKKDKKDKKEKKSKKRKAGEAGVEGDATQPQTDVLDDILGAADEDVNDFMQSFLEDAAAPIPEEAFIPSAEPPSAPDPSIEAYADDGGAPPAQTLPVGRKVQPGDTLDMTDPNYRSWKDPRHPNYAPVIKGKFTNQLEDQPRKKPRTSFSSIPLIPATHAGDMTPGPAGGGEVLAHSETLIGKLDDVMQAIKPKRPLQTTDREAGEFTKNFVEEMIETAEADLRQWEADNSSLLKNKMNMLPKAVQVMQKFVFGEHFVTHGGCRALAMWLRPMPDGQLPNTHLRTQLLSAMLRLPINKDNLQQCKEPSLGEIIAKLARNPHETIANRKAAGSLVQKWVKQVIVDKPTDDVFDVSSQSQMPTLKPKEVETAESFQHLEEESFKRVHPSIPVREGKEYVIHPETNAEPQRAFRYQEDSNRFKLNQVLTVFNRPNKKGWKPYEVSVAGRQLNQL